MPSIARSLYLPPLLVIGLLTSGFECGGRDNDTTLGPLPPSCRVDQRTGCAIPSGDVEADTGQDAGTDAGTPPEADAGTDAGIPPEADAGADAGTDVSTQELLLRTGESVMIGTCGVTGSFAEGDTLLWLEDPSGAVVASNDDGPVRQCGKASRLDFTASTEGLYRIRLGCAGGSPCQGSIAVSRLKALIPYAAQNTNSATLNTYNQQFWFTAGQTARVSTCAATAARSSATGDTYLRLFRQAAAVFSEVAANNDAQGCGSAAEILYQIPADGYYQFRAGCNINMDCIGTVAIYVE